MINKFEKSVLKRILFSFNIIFLLIAAPTGVMDHATAGEIVDRIVAVVNDEIITLSELNQRIKPYAEKVKSLRYPADKERELLFKVREDMLNQLIDQKLTDQEIKKSNISVDKREIDSAVERLKEANYFTDEELRQALARDNLTLEEYRSQMKEQILRNKLVNMKIRSSVVVTKADIQSYYDAHPEDYAGETKYHLRSILMKVSPFAGEERKRRVLKKMNDLELKLKQGESFKTLAENYSDSLADQGGDLGLFKIDELSSKIRESVMKMKPGEYTPVIETEYGYQFFFIEDIVNLPGKSIEDATPEIQEKLYNEIVNKKYVTWLEDLRKQSQILIIK